MKPSITISLFVLVLMTVICCAPQTSAQDSIPAQHLNEVVVKGGRQWIENGIITIIPTKSEKNLSDSPASLIKSMNLPYLKEKDGTIVNMAGETVQVFINGEKADEIDLATFWPKEVRRVQYLEHPKDPSFEGVTVAINFIVPKYAVGGVTRASYLQRFPNYGYGNASSKLVYKKMTYGVLLYGDYERDHQSSASGETTYHDIYYNGQKYDLLTMSESSHMVKKDDALNCAFNAKYTGDKFRMVHTVALGWNRDPGSYSDNENNWSYDLFKGSTSSNCTHSKSLTPQIKGTYFLQMSNKWFLSWQWQYAYAKSHRDSQNQMGTLEPILNSTIEDVNSAKLTILPTFMLSDKWAFQIEVNGSIDWFSTLYKGSANTRQHQNRQSLISDFTINWTPTRTLNLSLSPGIAISMWQIAQTNEHTVFPSVNSAFSWNPVRKFSLSGSLKFYTRAASAKESNPVLVRNHELLWVLGSPYLKNISFWDSYCFSTFIPNDWLSMSLGVGYVKIENEITDNYIVAPSEMGGLIKEIVNTKPSDHFRTSLDLSGSFFDDNLSIDLTPAFEYINFRGAYATSGGSNSLNSFTFSASADYTLNDFRFEIEYEGPYKDLDKAGMEKSWKQGSCNLALTYGNGNLYLQARVDNLFNTKQKSWIHYTSPHYTTKYNYLETGRNFFIRLTYTFGYGKKVDNSIDISGPDSVNTSVLSTTTK